jgi:hypothetical protein
MDHPVRCPNCGSTTHVKISTVGSGHELMGRLRKCDAPPCGFEFETIELTQDRHAFFNSILYRWNQLRAWALAPGP